MKKLSVLLTLIWLLSAIPAAANVIVGLPATIGSGNFIPFGYAYDTEYQQVYSSSQFSGPITITNLEFFNTQYKSGATAMPSGNWEISLSTTSAKWNTLSSTFVSNIGLNNTVVFNGNLSQSWAFGDTLSIRLSTPFTYDPAYGNLLMDVLGSGSGAGSTGGPTDIYFDMNVTNDYMGRVWSPVAPAESGYGLVTEFSSTAVPLPGGVLLLGSGLVPLAWARRKKLLGK